MTSDIVIVVGDRACDRSIDAVEPWLRDGAASIAGRVLAAGFEDLLPPARAMPGGFRALQALQQVWWQAGRRGGVEALELAGQVGDAILELRTAELRRAPLATTVYEAALDRLGSLGGALLPRELDAVPARHVDCRLEAAARRLERASRRPWPLRGWAVRRARASVLRLLRPLHGELEEVLSRHLAALAAASLRDRVAGWQEEVEASRARAAELRAGDGGPTLWAAFGGWLAGRSWLAPDLGPAALEEALSAFYRSEKRSGATSR